MAQASHGRDRQSIANFEDELHHLFSKHPRARLNDAGEPVIPGDAVVDILTSFSTLHKDVELMSKDEEDQLTQFFTSNPSLETTPQSLLPFIAQSIQNADTIGSSDVSKPPNYRPPLNSPFDPSNRPRSTPLGNVAPPGWTRRPSPAHRRKSDAGTSEHSLSDSESTSSNPNAWETTSSRSRAPPTPASPIGTSHSQATLPPDTSQVDPPPSRPHSPNELNPKSSSDLRDKSENNAGSLISPPSSSGTLHGEASFLSSISSLPMPSSGSDSDSDGGDASMLEYDRSTASDTASLEPLGRVEALQRINTNLSEKLIEAEKSLQNRLTEHESELEEIQSKLEELTNELIATKREEKEFRVKERYNLTQISALESEIAKLQRSLDNLRISYQSLQRQYQEQCAESERYRQILQRRDEEMKDHQDAATLHVLESQKLVREQVTFEDRIAHLEHDLILAQQAYVQLDEQKQDNLFLKETIDRMRFDMDEMRNNSANSLHQDESKNNSAKGSIFNDYSGNMNITYRERLSGPFAGAVGTDARYSTFTEYSGTVNITYGNRSSDISEIIAALKPADRRLRYVPRCMDGTREYVFKEIDRWLDNVDDPNILWLGGGPGSGKSVIASSIVSTLLERGRLGSDFFFRRGHATLSDPVALWRTVAFDLAQRNPTFSNAVAEALKTFDPARPSIDLHFKYLIKDPLTKTYDHSTPQLIPVIVIDALDECGSDRLQEEQREVLLDTFVQWLSLPKGFKLIITGREYRVPKSFRAFCKQIVLPTGSGVSAEVNKDIHLFFQKRFVELSGSSEWPGEQILDKLTMRAAGLFMWAETVIEFLKQGPLKEQLDLVLSGDLGEGDNVTMLYRQLLASLCGNMKGRTLELYKLVVSAVVLAKVPLHLDDLPQFLSEPRPSVEFILNKLSPIISVGITDKCLRITHLSFGEFLCDSKRCPEAFCIDPRRESQGLAMACFQQMKEKLKFNICDLETSYLRNNEVENLSERIRTKISGSLSYSCRYWAAHLLDSAGNQEDHGSLLVQVKEFLHHGLLFWLEVMSFAYDVSVANVALLTAIPWIEQYDRHLSTFVKDASRFVVNFDIPISTSVPHIYLSALPFSPSESLVAKQYSPLFPNTLSVVSGRDRNWPAMVNLFRGHTGAILAVAFSPDGGWVASGSADKTIRIWDVETGQLITEPFEGHTSAVTAVAFSRDGKAVVSGSHDKTIRIWNVDTGRVKGTLSGHNEAVVSVAFSQDGRQVVSSSSDKKILVWDVEMGHTTAGPFGSHSETFMCVAFSQDDKKVMSYSLDRTVEVWEIGTSMVTTCTHGAYTEAVRAIAPSPDGKLIVSGSLDRMVRVSEMMTGQITSGPFAGHTEAVNSVAFSLDGMRIVSGSDDKTIRIWDVGVNQVTTKLDTDVACSAVFSPKPRSVVLASVNMINPAWDVEYSRELSSQMERHSDKILSIGGARTLSRLRGQESTGWLLRGGLNPNSQQRDQLLFYVPQPYREGLCGIEVMVFYGACPTRLDLSRFEYGESWMKCYSPVNVFHILNPSIQVDPYAAQLPASPSEASFCTDTIISSPEFPPVDDPNLYPDTIPSLSDINAVSIYRRFNSGEPLTDRSSPESGRPESLGVRRLRTAVLALSPVIISCCLYVIRNNRSQP